MFHCALGAEGVGANWVHAYGEIDLTSAEHLAALLKEAQVTARLVVLDLHGVTFMDSSGVHVIEDASLEALIGDNRLVIVRAPPSVVRLFALTRTFECVGMLDFTLVGPPLRAKLRLVEPADVD